jgi:hypothetical protein
MSQNLLLATDRDASTTPAPDATESGQHAQPPTGVIGPIRRRTVDTVLIAAGSVIAIVLAVAGGLLTWGNNFAEDYVGDELSSQNIFFPDQASLEEEGRTDLVKYAGEQVTTGAEAEAYASYINGHLEETGGGLSYAELGTPQREARAALAAAQDAGEDEATIADLQAQVDEITSQRDSMFRGETLRGLLLSTFAWSTIGRIAGIAATVAFIGAAVMVVLVVLGVLHRHRTPATT